MSENALELRAVDVSAGDVPVCHHVDLVIPEGQVHVLFGPNGSGKSSLLAAIMGLPPYAVTAGEIRFRGTRIDTLPTDERARLGLGMAFQRPPSLQGVTVGAFSAALEASDLLGREAPGLDLGGFAQRDINSGFSGGEIKRWEVLKLSLQRPAMCLFDEPESGVDLEHIAAIGAAIDRLVHGSPDGPRSALLITHTGFVLDYVTADRGHLMIDGRIVTSGEPREMFTRIQRNGYSVALPGDDSFEERGEHR